MGFGESRVLICGGRDMWSLTDLLVRPGCQTNYVIATDGIVPLGIYDLLGQKVTTLVDAHQSTDLADPLKPYRHAQRRVL